MAMALLDTLARAEQPNSVECILTSRALFGLASVTLVSDVSDLIARRPDVVAECSGHKAVSAHVPAILAAGIDVVIASVGALMDDALLARLKTAASDGGARLLIPSGAVGALDVLAAMRLGGLTRVHYHGRKRPDAWPASTPGIENATEAATIFKGSAREAALRFPKNANVAAAVALAGLGPDATDVTLTSDPAVSGNVHEIEADGPFGSVRFAVTAMPLANNPSTSGLAALSIARTILNRTGVVVI